MTALDHPVAGLDTPLLQRHHRPGFPGHHCLSYARSFDVPGDGPAADTTRRLAAPRPAPSGLAGPPPKQADWLPPMRGARWRQYVRHVGSAGDQSRASQGADCPPWSRQASKASCWRLPACAVSPRPCLVTRTPWRAPHARPPPGTSLALELSRGARVRQYTRPADAEAVAACLARSPAIKPPASQAFSLALFRGTGAARTPSSGRRLFSCPGRLARAFACGRTYVPSIGCNTCILLAGYDIHAVPALAVPPASGSRSSRWLRRPSSCGRRCCGETATRPHKPAVGQGPAKLAGPAPGFRPRPAASSL